VRRCPQVGNVVRCLMCEDSNPIYIIALQKMMEYQDANTLKSA
jgi:hypothetical protein